MVCMERRQFGLAGARHLRRAGDQANRPLRSNKKRPTPATPPRGCETQSKKDVHKEPGHPGDEAGQMDTSQVGYRGGAADGGESAFVPIMKRKGATGHEDHAEYFGPRARLPEAPRAPDRGTGCPRSSRKAARSPMTNTSGWPGRLRSGASRTRPALTTTTLFMVYH